MFGPDLLVAPILVAGATSRTLYLPFGSTWKDAKSGKLYDGGQYVTVDAPMNVIPVFIKDNKDYMIYPENN